MPLQNIYLSNALGSHKQKGKPYGNTGIKQRTLKSKLDEMIENGLLIKEGEKKGTKYFINK